MRQGEAYEGTFSDRQALQPWAKGVNSQAPSKVQKLEISKKKNRAYKTEKKKKKKLQTLRSQHLRAVTDWMLLQPHQILIRKPHPQCDGAWREGLQEAGVRSLG